MPAGAVGMIQIRGPHILRGICRRSREELFTADGFYPTGDLGHLDADGFLFYHGRSDDMFKVSGATVYPSEVRGRAAAIAGIAGVAYRCSWSARQCGRRDGRLPPCGQRRGAPVAAQKVLSAFKVPTVWLMLGQRTRIPAAPPARSTWTGSAR